MDHRAERMKSLIIQTFFECLKTEDFSQLTVGQIAEHARINRSTFYRYFSDKYTLRDEIVDDIVQDFAEHMEVDFLHMNIEDEVHTLVPAGWTDPPVLTKVPTGNSVESKPAWKKCL
ncbi:MAG: TetR/AcrR family transcriptional regulator [Eubacterium ramulus]